MRLSLDEVFTAGIRLWDTPEHFKARMLLECQKLNIEPSIESINQAIIDRFGLDYYDTIMGEWTKRGNKEK